jgi:toxin ParE1/3/4
VAGKVYQRAAARRDLIEHFVYLAEAADLDAAERFLAAARTTFEDLAEHPTLGSPLQTKRADLAGMRKWRIKGFERYLIFYVPRRDGISIVRVLHGARDWWTLFSAQTRRG